MSQTRRTKFRARIVTHQQLFSPFPIQVQLAEKTMFDALSRILGNMNKDTFVFVTQHLIYRGPVLKDCQLGAPRQGCVRQAIAKLVGWHACRENGSRCSEIWQRARKGSGFRIAVKAEPL